MSNPSLGPTTVSGISLDGALLENQQEEGFIEDEKQQENELRALLDNAFDDLIDDDILSNTSDEGTVDSRNVSLLRQSADSFNIPSDDKIDEVPEMDTVWSRANHQNPAQMFDHTTGQPYSAHRYGGQFEPLSRTQEFPRGHFDAVRANFDAVRASVESLPNFPTNRGIGREADVLGSLAGRVDSDRHGSRGNVVSREMDSRGVASVQSSRDHIDSDYHTNADNSTKADFHGVQYPHPEVKGQSEGHPHRDNNDGHHPTHDAGFIGRENFLRKSIEDFAQLRELYGSEGQGHDQYFGNHGNHDGQDQGQVPAPHNQHCYVAGQSYEPSHYQQDPNPDQGHQGHPLHHHGYNGHFPNHHHFQNIYHNRPFHKIGEREETEGGNVQIDEHYYHAQHGYDPHGNQGHMAYYGQGHGHEDQTGYSSDYTQGYHSTNHAFYPYSGATESYNTDGNENQSQRAPNEAQQQIASQDQRYPNEIQQQNTNQNQRTPNDTQQQIVKQSQRYPNDTQQQNVNQSQRTPNDTQQQNVNQKQRYPNDIQKDYTSPKKKNKNVSQGSQRDSGKKRQLPDNRDLSNSYIARYKKKGGKEEKGSSGETRDRQTLDESVQEDPTEKAFMDQGGSADVQQLAQLQILYKARGRKIEELNNQLEVLRGESAREMRILKHHLSVAKGEKEGASTSLDSVQDLLKEARSENAQLVGRVNAGESQIEGLKKGKDELIKKLQTAEATIESLHQHLEELGSSDSLTRARHDHELVVAGLQSKYETQIKVLQEKLEKQNETLTDKANEVSRLQQKFAESVKAGEHAQISRAETINRLTQSLEESQKRCRVLLESTSSQDMSQMKIQLQQALASRSIADEMCSSLQEEIQDLKEQVQMLESASSLGLTNQGPPSYVDQNDSMADLGIKKTLDFNTPQGSPTISRSKSHAASTDAVSCLKAELERCMVSNKQKRSEVTDLKSDLRSVKSEMLEYKQRCERAELFTQEQKKRISELESCVGGGDHLNAIENRLKKDIDSLRREKKVLVEDNQELQSRLDEISTSEQKLTELNRELSKQIADMVTEYDQDKREALDRVQRACDQVSETSRNKLRQELTLQFDAERSEIITRYEKEVNKLRSELMAALDDVHRVKEMYMAMCKEKDSLKEKMDAEWNKKLNEEKLKLDQERDTLKETVETEWKHKLDQERDTLKETVETEWKHKLDQERDTLKETVESEWKHKLDEEKESLKGKIDADWQERLDDNIKQLKEVMEKKEELAMQRISETKEREKESELEKLKSDASLEIGTVKDKLIQELNAEHEREMKAMQEKFENEIKTMRDILEIEKSNDLEKIDKQKFNEIERLRKCLHEKEKQIEDLENERTSQNRNHRSEMEKKSKEIENIRTEMTARLDKLEAEKVDDINKLKQEIERIEKEKDAEIDKWRKDETEYNEVENLRKEIDKKNLKERQLDIDTLKKEVICLKLEIERMDTDKTLEIEKFYRVKQAEIENIEKRRQSEMDRLRKEKQKELDRVISEKDEEISRLSKAKEGKEVEDLSDKVKERLDRELEENVKKSLEAKVAMSKVVWLEEHRATRQTAIDNAVRLAETELRLKMEEDLEGELEKRLEEAKILWASDSMSQLEEERQNWEMVKEEEMVSRLEQEISARLEQEKTRWRQTDLQAEVETERQKWQREQEEKFEEEKASWREVELETERLQWALEAENRLQAARTSWEANVLEPAKRKWKLDAEHKLRSEKDNWRCMELEPEKLNIMREAEERLTKEKQTWLAKDFPAALEKEKENWQKDAEEKLVKEKELWLNDTNERIKQEKARWMKEDLAKEIEQEHEKWFNDVEERMKEERKNWKNCDLPEEIERERKKWMKLMEVTLQKERENWKTQDLPAQVEKAKQEMRQSMESEMEARLCEELESEKDKLQKDSEAKVLEAIEEHQEACKKELKTAIAAEKERMKQKIDEDLQERYLAEKKVWKEMVDQELGQKIEIEREKWKRKSESDLNKKLESEKEKLRSWLRADMEKRLVEEEKVLKEEFERENQEKLTEEAVKLRKKFEAEAKEDLEEMKAKLETEAKQDYDSMKLKIESELQMNFDTEKELMQLKYDRELNRRLESEEEKWKENFEQDLSTKLHKEEEKWKEMIEKDIETRLGQEREKWVIAKNNDWEKRLGEELVKWRIAWDEEKDKEIKMVREKFEAQMNHDMDVEVTKFKEDIENEFHSRLDHEVNVAIEEAREDWHREYTMEMSINTTSAEASQGVLREEIESLKRRVEALLGELLEKEEIWRKEREDLVLTKDLERRRDLNALQEQTESEYKQFISEHKDTLDRALKASREQNNKEKMELEERYQAQIKLVQAREKTMQRHLQESLQGTQEQSNALVEFEKDRVAWYEERDRLIQDVSERDSLLGKADVHLSKEVDKLRSELQAAYQRRLDTEMSSWKQKMEAELARMNNSEQKEKLLLEKQLSDFNLEMKKVKGQHAEEARKQAEEAGKQAEEIKRLTNQMNEWEKKVEEYDRMEGELKKAKELLKAFHDEVSDHQEALQKMKHESDNTQRDLQTKLNKTVQNQEKLQAELQTMKDEKSGLIESVQSIEVSYRKDVTMYKQKQDEANARISKTEKLLQEMKQKYRSELENLRKALEAENDVAMTTMKNKMVELQKKHVAIVDDLKKKHLAERSELLKSGQGNHGRGITPTPNMAEPEDIDLAWKELRSQYLDTVSKIKGDVLRHVTETNVRAAETVKSEVDKERTCTFSQIKEFYKTNVKQILESERAGSNIETKLQAVEEALGTLSPPSSRSITPRSDEYLMEDRQHKSRSHSQSRDAFSRDAGISPKGQRTVSFTSDHARSGIGRYDSALIDDPRSPKSRPLSKSMHDLNGSLRGERGYASEIRSGAWSHDNDSGLDTRKLENRPKSAKSARDLRERDLDVRASAERPCSAKSPHELHLQLRERNMDMRRSYDEDFISRYNREREQNRSVDKKKSRTLISTRDIHSGRYTGSQSGEDKVTPTSVESRSQRAKSTTPMYTSVTSSSPSLYRPTSVPNLNEDAELKLWSETNNDSYRYTPLRDTLRSGSNLHRSNSKSESDLSIAEKNFGHMKSDYDSNLDLSTGSLTSVDSFLSPRKSRDAGETPTHTPRRHRPRKHFTVHSFPTTDQMSGDVRNQTNFSSRHDEIGVTSPTAATPSSLSSASPSHITRERKNLPLIQFRQGKMQNLSRVGTNSSKSPHPDEPVMTRDTPPTHDTMSTPDRHYRPLSVSTNLHMDF